MSKLLRYIYRIFCSDPPTNGLDYIQSFVILWLYLYNIEVPWEIFLSISNIWLLDISFVSNLIYFYLGKATRVNFHVTVMSLDSINEGSMVSKYPDISPISIIKQRDTWKLLTVNTIYYVLSRILMRSPVLFESLSWTVWEGTARMHLLHFRFI